MSVKIRLKRMGSSKKPYYRIVVLDARDSGKGRSVEYLGTYNPKAKDNQVMNFKTESATKWIEKGATASLAVMGLLKKAGVKV